MNKWKKIFKEHMEDAIAEFEEGVTWAMEKAANELCESEIERMMLAELLFCPFGYHIGPHTIRSPAVPISVDRDVLIIPQLPISRYRADFGVLIKNFAGDVLQMVVECDGHDFHEKTKAQAQRDKKRDRDIQRAGWQVFRFTGSEIFRDVSECVGELDLHVANWIERDLSDRGIIGRSIKDDETGGGTT